MWLFAGPFFIFLGIGFFLGVVYLGIRYGIPFFFEACRLVTDVLYQAFGGFWAGLTGKETPKSRL
ncbi:MAG: hypothetical protein ACOX44_07925 [Limnochordia bacterium]|jgi:hypothetical protein